MAKYLKSTKKGCDIGCDICDIRYKDNKNVLKLLLYNYTNIIYYYIYFLSCIFFIFLVFSLYYMHTMSHTMSLEKYNF